MKIVVLLSAGIHPVSGRAVLPRIEAQAIALARTLSDDGDEVLGLHAGPDTRGVSAALGHGLRRIVHLEIVATANPVPALTDALAEIHPDLILAGRRAQGGEESGLLPYILANQLGLEIVADTVATHVEADRLTVDQALPRGVRRRVELSCPAVVTVHPAAPAPRPYAFAEERRGIVETRPGLLGAVEAPAAIEERPARPRPKLIGGGIAGSAADRLRAATQSGKAGGEVLVDPTPEEAARAILEHLRKVGALER